MGLSSFFGDNSQALQKYAQRINDLGHSYDPSVQGGKTAFGDLGKQLGMLLSNPAFMQNKLAGEFQQSPYQKSMIHQVTNQMNNNAANTGMLGSGAANNALAGQVSNDVGQFENNYINQGLGQYDHGLNQGDFMSNLGMNGLNSANQYFQQGDQARLMADMSHQNAMNSMIGTGLGLAMKAIPAISGMGGLSGLASKIGSFL